MPPATNPPPPPRCYTPTKKGTRLLCKNHWTKGLNCLWWGHSVNRYQPLIPLLHAPSLYVLCMCFVYVEGLRAGQHAEFKPNSGYNLEIHLNVHNQITLIAAHVWCHNLSIKRRKQMVLTVSFSSRCCRGSAVAPLKGWQPQVAQFSLTATAQICISTRALGVSLRCKTTPSLLPLVIPACDYPLPLLCTSFPPSHVG